MNRRQPYRPQPPQIPADPLRGNPCDSRDPRKPLQPLKGLGELRAASVSYQASVPAGHACRRVALSYRALSPGGETLPCGIKGVPSVLPQPIPNSKFLIPNWSFTFSAKEKDSETGLSYFGSRYYSSDLSIWLSVDPMSDKYAYQSSYVYCGNNPLKVIDPNGEDEWEVNQSGYIRHIKNDKPDRLYAVYGFGKERWGKRKSDVAPLDVDKSIMKTMSNFGKYTTFSADNKREKMDDLFNFLADNTDVEWTQLSIHDQYENEYDFLSTSHENIESDLPLAYNAMVHANAKKGTLDTFKHSHPNNYTGFKIYYKIIYPYTCHIPSEGDKKTKKEILDECRSDKPLPRFF